MRQLRPLVYFDSVSQSKKEALAALAEELPQRLIAFQAEVFDRARQFRDENTHFSETVRVYLRDCYDHSVHALDLVESYREMASSLLEIFLSSLSNRMNDIMKVLTIIATIFIPLTFLAGIYGMNFQYMPELAWKWSYPLLLIIMLVLGIGMYIYMRRRRWF